MTIKWESLLYEIIEEYYTNESVQLVEKSCITEDISYNGKGFKERDNIKNTCGHNYNLKQVNYSSRYNNDDNNNNIRQLNCNNENDDNNKNAKEHTVTLCLDDTCINKKVDVRVYGISPVTFLEKQIKLKNNVNERLIWADEPWCQTALTNIPEWMKLPGIDYKITLSNLSDKENEDTLKRSQEDEFDLSNPYQVGNWADEPWVQTTIDVPEWARLPGIDYPFSY